jgi:hypothetical protein
MDFLEGGVVLSGFPPFSFTGYITHCRNYKRLREFEKYKSQGKAEEVTLNRKEENT